MKLSFPKVVEEETRCIDIYQQKQTKPLRTDPRKTAARIVSTLPAGRKCVCISGNFISNIFVLAGAVALVMISYITIIGIDYVRLLPPTSTKWIETAIYVS